jgi:hypothetical protein
VLTAYQLADNSEKKSVAMLVQQMESLRVELLVITMVDYLEGLKAARRDDHSVFL